MGLGFKFLKNWRTPPNRGP